jgi:nitroimidazol reductase NimA-like FMN-containing flavoprotein (pyridoxamine 5'-phosphate oxidase superfamily)
VALRKDSISLSATPRILARLGGELLSFSTIQYKLVVMADSVPNRVAVIGCGNVGATSAYELITSGVAREGRPYVVPMHCSYDSQDFYFITTEGMKTSFIEANSEVCFQVEEVTDAQNWRSCMVTGRAERITQAEELERAMQIITEHNPTLTPAINRTDVDTWGRSNTIAVYRIRPEIIDGRKTTSS